MHLKSRGMMLRPWTSIGNNTLQRQGLFALHLDRGQDEKGIAGNARDIPSPIPGQQKPHLSLLLFNVEGKEGPWIELNWPSSNQESNF